MNGLLCTFIPSMVVLAAGGWIVWKVWSAQKGNAKQRTRTIFQYLRLLRFELLFFLALIALPVIATEIARSLLANLLVVDSAADAIAVTQSDRVIVSGH